MRGQIAHEGDFEALSDSIVSEEHGLSDKEGRASHEWEWRSCAGDTMDPISGAENCKLSDPRFCDGGSECKGFQGS